MASVGQTITNPVAGDSVTFLEVPGGATTRLVLEMTTVPGGHGPPEHIHPHSSEEFAVLSGSLLVREAGEDHVVAAGEKYVVPAGAVHNFGSYGDVAAVTRVSFDRPGRMGDFLETFYELSRAGLTDAEGKPSMQQIAVTCSQLKDDLRTVVAPWPAQLALFAVLAPVGRRRGLKPFYASGELASLDD